MLTLTRFASEITKLEKAANAADAARDRSLFTYFWDQRCAFNMAATYLRPRDHDEVIFLHQLLQAFVEFVDDEPTRDSDRDDAIAAIHRMTESLRDYAIGA